jgi:hypothetical protein
MVRLHTRIPSLSNSPRMRSAQKTPVVLGHCVEQEDGLWGHLLFVRGHLCLLLTAEAETLMMPTQKRLWLDNEQRLLPCLNSSCQQYQHSQIRLGASWPLDLSAQEKKLVPYQCIFCYQLRFTSEEITHYGEYERGIERFGPTCQARGESLEVQNHRVLGRVEHTLQNIHRSIAKMIVDKTRYMYCYPPIVLSCQSHLQGEVEHWCPALKKLIF